MTVGISPADYNKLRSANIVTWFRYQADKKYHSRAACPVGRQLRPQGRRRLRENVQETDERPPITQEEPSKKPITLYKFAERRFAMIKRPPISCALQIVLGAQSRASLQEIRGQVDQGD
jgi:alpha-beta hydrolase superfamily lysophospholipase